MIKEILFVSMIGTSFFFIPYHIHKLMPVTSTMSIISETSSAFFFLYVFITCGSIDMAVSKPAQRPRIAVKFSFSIIVNACGYLLLF